MSSTEQAGAPGAASAVPTAPGGPPVPVRVRHQAREALAVMAFSAATSVVLALGLLLLTHAGR